MKILHLSDLHFGSDKSDIQKLSRDVVLEDFKQSLQLKFKKDQAGIDFIAISGDIAHASTPQDYAAAKKFITDLSLILKVPAQNIILCPGNHDKEIDGEYFKLIDAYKDSIDRGGDKINFHLGELNKFKRDHRNAIRKQITNTNYGSALGSFSHYNDFCQELGIIKPKSNLLTNNYTCGYVINKEKDIAFILLNSALLALGGKEDYGNLEVFPSIIDQIFNNLKSDADFNPAHTLVVSLIHHSESWLNWKEVYGLDKASQVYEKLASKSNIILSGHEHGNIKHPDLIGNMCQRFIGGATYTDPETGHRFYINNYSVLEISEDRKFIRREKAYFNSTVDVKWNFVPEEEDRRFPIDLESLNFTKFEGLKEENNLLRQEIEKLNSKLQIYVDEINNRKFKVKLNSPDIFWELKLTSPSPTNIIKNIIKDLEDRKFNVAGSSQTAIKDYKIHNKHVKFIDINLNDYYKDKQNQAAEINSKITKALRDTDKIVILAPYLYPDDTNITDLIYYDLKSRVNANESVIVLNPYKLLINNNK